MIIMESEYDDEYNKQYTYLSIQFTISICFYGTVQFKYDWSYDVCRESQHENI